MMKIGIVILNYLAYQDTIECVESILLQSFQNFEVVVVENGSDNDSLLRLQERFGNDNKISILSTGKNIGFAKGNNAGIAFLKEKGIYKVLVINGDTVIEQTDYLKQLQQIKYDETVGMVGTRIITKDKFNQNTTRVIFKNAFDVTFFNLYKILSLFRKKQQADSQSIETTHLLDLSERQLHGAAILFTENYLYQYIGFYPDTFLYVEEDLLAAICRKLSFKQLYISELSIYHKEDKSSDMAWSRSERHAVKRKFINESLKELKKVYQMSSDELKAVMKG